MKVDNNLSGNVITSFLRTLSPIEFSEFEKFAASPYFNKGRNYNPLLKALKKFYPEFNSDSFTKEIIYSDLYPGREYKESVLKTMLSRLYNLGEEFLVQQEFGNENNINRDCLTLRVLDARGLRSRSEKRIREIENRLNNEKINRDYFLNKKNFNMELSYYLYNNEKRESVFASINENLRYIIFSFIAEVFHFDFSMYTQRNFWKYDYEKSYVYRILENIDFENIFKLIKENDKKEFPILKISYLLHLSIKHIDKDEYYFELKNNVFNFLDRLETDYKRQMMNLLALISTLKFVSGKNDFKVEAFEIKKKSIEEDLFSMTNNSYIKTSEFRSVFIEALNVYQKDWAVEFAENYIKRLPPEYRDDIEYYCRSRIAYEDKKYDESLELAMKVNINQITFKLDIKNVMAKIYYDTGSVESLYSHLNAYYQTVKNSDSRNKEFLQRHFKFVKYLKNLQTLRLNYKDRSEFGFLRIKISKENVTAKSWLIKKTEEAESNLRNK